MAPQASEAPEEEQEQAAKRVLERARDMMARELAAEPGVRAFVRAKLNAHATLTTGASPRRAPSPLRAAPPLERCHAVAAGSARSPTSRAEASSCVAQASADPGSGCQSTEHLSVSDAVRQCPYDICDSRMVPAP